MKTSLFKQYLLAGLTVAGLTLASRTQANVEVFIEGGSASSGVLYQLATNILNGGTITANTANSVVRTYSGTSTLPSLSGYGTITIDYNLNGAVQGLQNLTLQHTDTNIAGTAIIPVAVDSATSPEAVNISSSTYNLVALPTYVVPLVYAKNANSTDTASITNLTQRQAVSLETSYPQLPSSYFGGATTNPVYFVGRNLESAVRTEIEFAIYNNGATIYNTLTNSLGNPVLDTSSDPGFSSSGSEFNTASKLTNSISTFAVQNIKSPLVALSFEGVPYSVTNVINGSYPLWGYENYYYIGSGPHALTGAQLTVLNALYNSVTNTAFQSTTNPVFSTYYIPNSSLQVNRSFDGGQIYPN